MGPSPRGVALYATKPRLVTTLTLDATTSHNRDGAPTCRSETAPSPRSTPNSNTIQRPTKPNCLHPDRVARKHHWLRPPVANTNHNPEFESIGRKLPTFGKSPRA